jgi:hypothetical protein
MLAAILHIVGAIISLLLFFFITGLIENARSVRRRDHVLSAAAIRLGIPIDQLDRKEHSKVLAQYLMNEYDGNSLKNRVSDISQPFFTLYEALNYMIQLGIVALAVWAALNDNYAQASNVWVALVVALVLFIGSRLLEAALYLVTGRSPGEARDGRCFAKNLNRN